MYLHVRVIESLIAGKPFLYQSNNGTVYHVAENGVEEIWSWSSNAKIVAFVDGDQENCEPKTFLFKSSVQIILSSPPKGAYQKWIQQAEPDTDVTKLAIKLWSPQELFLAGLVLAFLLSTPD